VYQRVIDSSLRNVWASITDPCVVEVHLPGQASVTKTGDKKYRVSFKISVGFFRPTVNINVHFSGIVDLASVDIEVTGKSMGAAVCGAGTIVIAPTDVGLTNLEINAEVQSSGLLNNVDDSKIKTATAEFIDAYLSKVETV
jgi:carbon monoxide dehydrogenase subunit G